MSEGGVFWRAGFRRVVVIPRDCALLSLTAVKGQPARTGLDF